MAKRPWYKRYPSDFIAGTIGLSLEEKGAYSICLDLIYDRGGPIPDDARWIAGVCGCSVRKWVALRAALISTGKLLADDGHLTNNRARREISALDRASEAAAASGAKGGRKRAENSSRIEKLDDLISQSTENKVAENGAAPSDINNLGQATLNHRAREEARSQIPEAREEIDIGIAVTGNPPARQPSSDDRDKRAEPLASSPAERPTMNGQGAPAQQSLIPLDQTQPSPKRPRKVRTALPSDWRLPDDGWTYAAGKGLTGDRIEQEAEKFRDYHLSRGNVMADWAAAWRTWVGNAGKFSGPITGGFGQRDPPSRADSAIQGIKNYLIRTGELS
jgi:uncharacterized protein YdaU (DUF1376 family)